MRLLSYKLTVLTPIHIYSGETYRPLNYFINKDNMVQIFDEMDVIKSIKNNQMLNDELLRNMTMTNKRTEYHKNLDYFIDKDIVDKSILNKRKVEANNRVKNLKGQEINKTMRNIQGIFIPGSTIKGIIRTAIIYDYLLSKGIDFVKKAILSISNTKSNIDDYIIFKNEQSGRIEKDIAKDPFRFISVKDINMINNKVEIYEENIFNIDGFIPGNVIETIKEGDSSEEFAFEIRTNFNISRKFNQEILKYFSNDEILRVLYQYSNDIIEDEIEYFKNNKNADLNSKEIIEKLQEIKSKNSLSTPVLRIGKSTGYKSHTVALVIKKMDKEYYLKSAKSIAKPPKYNKNFEYPKTRKIINGCVSPKLLGFAIIEKVN